MASQGRIKLLILSILLFPSLAFGATYYVDGSCGTSGNGTTVTCGVPNGPWKTLAEAASGVPSGAAHTISVAAGTYSASLSDSRSGVTPCGLADSSGCRHWLANGTVTISGGNVDLTGSYVKFEGFTINNSPARWNRAVHLDGSYIYFKNNTISNSNRGGLEMYNSSITGCIIEGNTFFNIPGIVMDVMGSNHLILNNDISDWYMDTAKAPSYEDGDAFNIFGSGHTFRGNYIHNYYYNHNSAASHVDVFQMDGDMTDPKIPAINILIEGNHIFLGTDSDGVLSNSWDDDNSMTGFMLGAGTGSTIRNNVIEAHGAIIQGTSGSPSNLKIYNNTFISSATWTVPNSGIHANQVGVYINSGTGWEIKNNIFVNLKYAEIKIESLGIAPTSNYNLFYHTDASAPAFHIMTDSPYSNTLAEWRMHTSQDANSINVDPLFTTYPPSTPIVKSPANYKLQSSSPAKDAGTTIATVTDDYDGVSRPRGSAYDIGAYEYEEGTGGTESTKMVWS